MSGGSVIEHGSVIPRTREGANPIPPLQFSRTTLKDVSSFIKTHHYSHTHPGGIDFAFRLDWNGQFAGACVYGYMAGNPKAMCVLRGHDNSRDYRELMRLVLLDAVPKNSETCFVAWTLRWLKKHTMLKAILSFADPAYGHAGTIYRAGNWIYTGLQKQDRPHLIINDKVIHPRQAVAIYGTSSIPKLRAQGFEINTSPRLPKHRYVYVLRPQLTGLLKYESVAWKDATTAASDVVVAA